MGPVAGEPVFKPAYEFFGLPVSVAPRLQLDRLARVRIQVGYVEGGVLGSGDQPEKKEGRQLLGS